MLLYQLQSAQIFSRMPRRMRAELSLTPTMLQSVTLLPPSTGEGFRETTLIVQMAEGSTEEQNATLFHFVTHETYMMIRELYHPLEFPPQKVAADAAVARTHSQSRFAGYEADWQKLWVTPRLSPAPIPDETPQLDGE